MATVLETKTKAKSTLLTTGVAIANTVGVMFGLPALTIPDVADTAAAITAVVVWALNVLVMYTPTIVSTIGNAIYVNNKTKQNIAGIAAGSSQPVSAGSKVSAGNSNSEAAAVASGESSNPESVPDSYAIPFNPAEYKKNTSAYLAWEEFQDLLTLVDLRDYNPEIRLEFGQQVVDEGFKRIQTAWQEAFAQAGARETVKFPTAADFDGYDLKEPLKAELEKTLPNECDRLSTRVKNITMLAIACAKMYELQSNLNALKGKTINWTKVATLSDIHRVGLAAV